MTRQERIAAAVAGVLVLALLIQVGGQLREGARRDALRRDLLGFALAQESYYYDHKVYAADAAAFAGRGFRPVAAARIVVQEATRQGWSAVAWHADGAIRCVLYVKQAAPVGPATADGAVRCA